MPLHPEYELLLKQMAEVGGPALSEMPVEQGREMYRMMQPENPTLEVGSVQAQQIPGPACLLYTSPSPRDATLSRMPSSA